MIKSLFENSIVENFSTIRAFIKNIELTIRQYWIKNLLQEN